MLVVLLAAAGAGETWAQTDTVFTTRDTVRVHELDEIVIQAPRASAVALPYTLIDVAPTRLAELDPAAVADLARVVPAAHTQTNSRGETLVYLRNAGERQVAAFLDGALLNVPWDNRVDLSLVPASLVHGLSVVQGVPPVEYGANVLGGAINLRSPSWAQARPPMEASTAAGTMGLLQATVAARGTSGPWLYAGAVGHSTRDAVALPEGANLAFSQLDPDRRTNTDARITSVSARAAHRFAGGGEMGLSLFYVDGAKGVAPEGHKDPAVSTVRFWRYPDWRNAMAIFSAHGTVGGATAWKGAAWINAFHQSINAYTSVNYDSLDSREEDRDVTVGGRLVAQHAFGASTGKLSLNALTSTHRQRDLELEPTGQPAAGQVFPELEYRQAVLSAGAEYDLRITRLLRATFGASVDAMIAPQTGDKPAIDPFTDYSATLGVAYRLGHAWQVRANAGRKTRFPTMRELFGEALNRFLLNSDLRPETSWLAEIALGLERRGLEVAIVPFAARTSNTIDQRSVLVPGETRPRRQRVNLRGSRVLGVEVAATLTPARDVSATGHLTLSQARRLPDASNDPVYLSEKPDVLGYLALSYRPAAGFNGLLDATYTGRAYSLDDNNVFVALPTSLALNARVGYRFPFPAGRWLEPYVRVDNVTDAFIVPQLGLPEAGRMAQGGVKASF